MTLEELEVRVKLLEDIEAIKKLQAAFCYAVDSFDWQRVVNLFTDDAVAEYGTFGHYEGKEQITQFYRDMLPKSMSFLEHMCHNFTIEVKGEKATGEFYFETPATQISPKRAFWIAGKYEGNYVNVNGEWKIKKLTSATYYNTPYENGWVKTRMPE